MRLSRHERFLQELRTPVKQCQRKQQQKRRKKGSGAPPDLVPPSTSVEFAGLSDPNDQLSLEELLEKKFDELFGKIDDSG